MSGSVEKVSSTVSMADVAKSSYALQWIVALPLEIIAGSLAIGYWNPAIDKAILVTVFLVVIVAINLFGVKGYGEAEFVL